MKFIGRSHQGLVRTNNEDALAFDGDVDVALLADGMGGLEAGELASSAAVEAVLEKLRVESVDTTLVAACFEIANRCVRELAAARASLGNMGTTLVLWVATGPDRCVIGHVGDSRAYRFRDGRLAQLTRDHSVVQRMVDDGVITPEEARISPSRNIITRGVGLDLRVEPEVIELGFLPADRFMLCSDGLTDMLTDPEIAEILGESDPQVAVDALINAANQAGGRDNVSVLLIDGCGEHQKRFQK